MSRPNISDLSAAATGLATITSELRMYFSIDEKSGTLYYDIRKPIIDRDITFLDCETRIIQVADMLSKPAKTSGTILAPLPRLNAFKNSVETAKSHIQSIEKLFRTNVKQQNGFKEFDYSNFQIVCNNGSRLDARSQLLKFADSTEVLLDAFFNLELALRPYTGRNSYASATKALTTLISKANDELQALKKDITSARSILKTSNVNAETIKINAEETGRIKEEIEKDRKTVSEYLAEATERNKAIESVHSAASSLESAISNYHTKFENFDRQIDTREEKYIEGTIQLNKLNSEYEAEINNAGKLIEQSEKMLKGATVAGLASSFAEAQKKLDSQLFWARSAFYLGIVLLFISSIPLIAHVFLPIIYPFIYSEVPNIEKYSGIFQIQSNSTGWQYLGQVVARLIVLLPAAWLVSFSAMRHSSLFRLREHYAYKYSMAVSVEGFRKQAKGYENEIAALVLEQLAFNPADKLASAKDSKEGKVPHPLLDILINKLRTKIAPTDEVK